MSEEIKCPDHKCQSANFLNLHAEQNIVTKPEGKSLQWPKKKGPKYQCRDCGRKF